MGSMEDERCLHLLQQTQVPATWALVPLPAAEAARAAARRPTTRPWVQPQYIPAAGVKERDLAPRSKHLLDKQLRIRSVTHFLQTRALLTTSSYFSNENLQPSSTR
jgi:hypothetical protein